MHALLQLAGTGLQPVPLEGTSLPSFGSPASRKRILDLRNVSATVQPDNDDPIESTHFFLVLVRVGDPPDVPISLPHRRPPPLRALTHEVKPGEVLLDQPEEGGGGGGGESRDSGSVGERRGRRSCQMGPWRQCQYVGQVLPPLALPVSKVAEQRCCCPMNQSFPRVTCREFALPPCCSCLPQKAKAS